MRYEYTITKEGGTTEVIRLMGWKRAIKSVLLKDPKFSGWISYINKKGHLQERNFIDGKEIKK